jgi:signal transduction histidine kinase
MMTTSLLDVAKLESQTLPLSIERIDVSELVRQRAHLVNHQMKSRSLSFNLVNNQPPSLANADAYLLTRVIDNLLFNAIKFCPNGGTITASFTGSESESTMALANDGPPIPAEYHDKIFAAFGQIESQQQRSSRGVGLGLALCRMASLAMNGNIAVESPLVPRQDGVCFKVTLPKASGK